MEGRDSVFAWAPLGLFPPSGHRGDAESGEEGAQKQIPLQRTCACMCVCAYTLAHTYTLTHTKE